MSLTALPRGKMTDLLLKVQADFTTAATGDYPRLPVYSHSFGERFGLPEDPLLNAPRVNDADMTAPGPDVHRHEGQLVMPLCINHLGYMLLGAFGAPVTTAVAATGTLLFSGQPDAGSTITINGVEFTFVAGSPGADEIEIGGTLGDTITAIVTALNGSADTDVDDATYDEASGTTVTIEHDTAGPDGNAFTLAASAASNATASGTTLSGGCYSHVFASGGEALPAFSIEQKLRNSGTAGGPKYRRHLGNFVNVLNFRMGFEEGFRRLEAEFLGWKEEDATDTSQGGTPTTLALDQMPAVKGVLRLDDVAMGSVLGVDAAYRNNLASLDFVSDEEYVSGYERGGEAAFNGQLRLRYVNEAMYEIARAASVHDLEMEWRLSATRSLVLTAPGTRIEKGADAFNGPAGVEQTFPFRSEQSASAGMLTATLRNAVAAY